MTMFSFFVKCLSALNSESVRFSGGSRPLEKFLYELSAVSNSLALNKDVSSLRKSSCFCRRMITQEVVKTLEYSINPGFPEKLRPLNKTFFVISQFIRRKIKRLPSQDYDYH